MQVLTAPIILDDQEVLLEYGDFVCGDGFEPSYMLLIRRAPKVRLRGLRFDGTNGPQGTSFYGAMIQDCEDVLIEGCHFQHFPRNGIDFIGCNNVELRHCSTFDTRGGFSFAYERINTNVRVLNCTTESMRDQGDGIHGYLYGGLIQNHRPIGYHYGTIKLVCSQIVQILDCSAYGLMLQGTQYGPPPDYHNHPAFPLGEDWRDSQNLTVQNCDFTVDYSRQLRHDGSRGNSAGKDVVLSYPQHGVNFLDCVWNPDSPNWHMDVWGHVRAAVYRQSGLKLEKLRIREESQLIGIG